MGDVHLLVFVGDLSKLGPGPSVGRNQRGLSLERATKWSLDALNDVRGVRP